MILMRLVFTLKDGTKHKIRVKKYNCKSCGKSSQVEFPDEFEPYSHVSNEVDEMIRKMNSLHWISLRDISKNIKNNFWHRIIS